MYVPEIDISYTQNREVSWLRFNERVLDEARDVSVPLYERLKFAAIFSNNLDEFYMVRVGSLFELAQLKNNKFDNKSFLTPDEQLKQIFAATKHLCEKRDQVFKELDKALKKQDIVRVNMKKSNQDDAKFIEQYVTHKILPILSPQIIDLHHPFPHLVNKMLYIAVLLKHKKKLTLGMIPVPTALPKVIFFPGNKLKYILMEQIIIESIHRVFEGYSFVDKAVISVTRNADISPDDEVPELGDDYLHHMKKTLRKRKKLAPVRIELETSGDSLICKHLLKRLQISEEQVFMSEAPINLDYVFSLSARFTDAQKQQLIYPPFKQQRECGIPAGEKILDYVAKKDILLEYPYQDFEVFLQLVKEAVYDESAVSIKITIYRIGKNKAKLMNYLITAAELGKDVTVLMELKARFDEENNINWAEFLQEAGCKILYGFEGYKVHSKICLITRQDGDEISYITQVGTGNYNAQTAGMYTDLSLITGNQDIGHDAAVFFKNMGIDNLDGVYEHLLVAPNGLKKRLLELVADEAEKARQGKDARILLKMNSLTDRQLIDALADASQCGVKIELIIRGICCILPQVAGKTDNIRVRSIVGRFLEHSRIFCFGVGEEMQIFLSSADWMTRNTEKRVEIVCPVYDIELKNKIFQHLQIMLQDTVKGRSLNCKGIYSHDVSTDGININSQQYFMEYYACLN